MEQLIRLDVNADVYEVTVQPYETLLQTLRERLGLIGAKRGCDTGGCGCCTVLVDGKAMYSCMLFALSAQNKKITTVEGLIEHGKLDPLQEAFIETGAVQCGYCTCGIIMVAKELLAAGKPPNEQEIRQAIAGNLCRCTGYHKIVEAIKIASASH